MLTNFDVILAAFIISNTVYWYLFRAVIVCWTIAFTILSVLVVHYVRSFKIISLLNLVMLTDLTVF